MGKQRGRSWRLERLAGGPANEQAFDRRPQQADLRIELVETAPAIVAGLFVAAGELNLQSLGRVQHHFEERRIGGVGAREIRLGKGTVEAPIPDLLGAVIPGLTEVQLAPLHAKGKARRAARHVPELTGSDCVVGLQLARVDRLTQTGQPFHHGRIVVGRIARLDGARDGERIPEFAQSRATMRLGRIVGRCVRTGRSAIAIRCQARAIDDRVITLEPRVIPRVLEPDLPVEARVAELAVQAAGDAVGILTGVLDGP